MARANHIPDDLMFYILSKLPVKSLKKCACVCKSWSLLFQNPSFMSIYRSKFLSSHEDIPLMVLYREDQNELYSLSGKKFEKMVKLDWPPPIERNDIVCLLESGSINGVLFLCQGSTKVVLWNPATREFKVVPPSLFELQPNDRAHVRFNGFGYDPVRDDYKVILQV
ncbi:putative F-box protein At3g16210 [Cajanus cajan]|uniref:putative F-box protein At3g16210 n=1 Tax=Cajanus cajan TaxID=3821 RepID=UPI00098DBA5A|nr:putative F-box protein At3g16210 [Cajanus cajan]